MIGFFGGTFDPVHLGHLHAARTVVRLLRCDTLHLVLAARPAHRAPPVASVQHRWAMLELAVAGDPVCVADDREIRRPTPSYTVDTLEAVRAEVGEGTSLVWCIGFDQLRDLLTWHRPERLLELAHLLVLARPDAGGEAALPPKTGGEAARTSKNSGEAAWTSKNSGEAALPAEVQAFIANRMTDDPAHLDLGVGRIFRCRAPMLPISASAVRRALVRGEPVDQLLPREVSTYIRRHRLYGGSGDP